MKLTPQPWVWERSAPDSAWLAERRADPPALWQVWLTEDADMQSHLHSLLSPAERVRLARFRQREDQRRFLTGRGLLRILTGAHMQIPAERVEFDCGPGGKPFVASPLGMPPLHFNVSHSGKLVLLAFHPSHQVGVDVEAMRNHADLAETARQFMAPGEYRKWHQLDPVEQIAAFYRTWTCHEAGLKAMGIGFTSQRHGDLDARLEFFELALPEGYQGAAACLCRAADLPPGETPV